MKDSIGRENRKIADKNCEVCGVLFRPVDSKKRTCSRTCGYKIRVLNPKNKGTGFGWINKKGYREIRVDGKIRKEHRFLYEQFYKITLDKKDDIHHINGIKTDNRIENLKLISHSEHSKITNIREYKKGYKMVLSEIERNRRSISMKQMRNNAIKKATE